MPNNKENRFAKAAQARKKEQEKIKQKLTSNIDDTENKEPRTTMSLSLTVEDKKKLKTLAAQRETTVATLIHEWLNNELSN